MKALPLLAAASRRLRDRAGGRDEEPYRALGTEPFWSITVANGRMTYESPEGGFSVPAPRGAGARRRADLGDPADHAPGLEPANAATG